MTTASESGHRPLVRSIYSTGWSVIWAFHDCGLRKRTIRPSVRGIYSVRGAVMNCPPSGQAEMIVKLLGYTGFLSFTSHGVFLLYLIKEFPHSLFFFILGE
jgi:hypothetical protein